MARLFVDTNIVIDALARRKPHDKAASLLLCLGEVGECDLWLSTSQLTDIFYILSGSSSKARMAAAKEQLVSLRKSISLFPLAVEDVDQALASRWAGFEDACVYYVAQQVKAEAIITNNKSDFELSAIPVFTCEEYFEWLECEKGIVYGEVALN